MLVVTKDFVFLLMDNIKVGYLKLNEIRKILADSGLMLTKSLGQNFLHDGNQLARIVSLASINPGDRVLEVGPGMGALTGPLLDAGAHVTSIEKDQRLVGFLKNHRLQNHPRFELIHDDALDLIKRHDRDWTGFKFVSNLPYSVGSPIIVELALSATPPDILVISLQLEVIERIFAGAGKKEYGLLSILMQLSRTSIVLTFLLFSKVLEESLLSHMYCGCSCGGRKGGDDEK